MMGLVAVEATEVLVALEESAEPAAFAEPVELLMRCIASHPILQIVGNKHRQPHSKLFQAGPYNYLVSVHTNYHSIWTREST